MQAMVLKKLRTALKRTDLADRQPAPGEIRIKAAACSVCRTGTTALRTGDHVGMPLPGHTHTHLLFTGYTRGVATATIADAR